MTAAKTRIAIAPVTTMTMNFFEWLEQNSPGYTKKIFDTFNQAMEGRIHNPFQWRATEKALDTQFSKAAQKVEQHNTGEIKYVIERGQDSVISAPSQPAEDSGLTS